MHYDSAAIPDTEIPRAIDPPFQHLLDTYASEANKVISVWQAFTDADLEWRPHPQSSTVGEILRHQLLSERRFFAEFLGIPEAPAELVLPAEVTVEACRDRLRQMVVRRLPLLSSQPQAWWLESVPFFDVRRQRIWVFWRRVLHTCHHRTQFMDPPPTSRGRTRIRRTRSRRQRGPDVQAAIFNRESRESLSVRAGSL